MTPDTDEAWMVRLQGGDAGALEVLYHRYADRLMGFLYRMLDGDRSRAEDLLQDVFVRLATSHRHFDPSRSFRPWIFTIAANLARNAHRHQAYTDPGEDAITLPHEDPSPASFQLDHLDRHLFQTLLDRSLLEISPEKRSAFLLRYQEHFSLAEIAEIQVCAIGTVKSRIFYTLRFLETTLTAFKPEHTRT